MAAKKLNVTFGSVTIAKKVVRLTVSINRDKLPLDEADDLFAASQLDARLCCDPQADTDTKGQQKMVDTKVELDITPNVSGYHVYEHAFSVSFVMPKKSVDKNLLGQFSAREGTVTCKRKGAPVEIPGENTLFDKKEDKGKTSKKKSRSFGPFAKKNRKKAK